MEQSTIIIAGGSGFLGSHLKRFLRAAGHHVGILTRSPRSEDDIEWDGASPGAWTERLEEAAAVINLAGRSIDCRHDEGNRRAILDSRVHATRAIGDAVSGCRVPPAVWINASAVAYYGDRRDRDFDEDDPAGDSGFLVDVARRWEHEVVESSAPRTRRIRLRISLVLGDDPGSAHRVLSRLARFGLGGRAGDGGQYVSWIHVDDFCRAVAWILRTPQIEGAVNACSPTPCTNSDLMAAYRRAHEMPFGLPAPAPLLRLGAIVMGTAPELVLTSQRVVPRRLMDSGFGFRYPDLDGALAALRDGD